MSLHNPASPPWKIKRDRPLCWHGYAPYFKGNRAVGFMARVKVDKPRKGGK